MASTAQEEVKISIITRSGAGIETQPFAETEQYEDIEVKEEQVTKQITESSSNQGRSMALGGLHSTNHRCNNKEVSVSNL